MQQDVAYTVTQAAEYLAVQPKTLANWRGTGRGPVFVKYGAGDRAPVRYLLSDLDTFRIQNRRASTSATEPPELVS